MTFKYQIGDVLTHKAALVEPIPCENARLFVLERRTQECPGGIQNHYMVTAIPSLNERSGSGLMCSKADHRCFNEAELAHWSEYVVMKEIEALAESQLAKVVEASGFPEEEPGQGAN